MLRKRRFKIRKMSFIYLGILISMNIIGIGYGKWASTISIENTLQTGEVKAVFSNSLSQIGYDNVSYGQGNDNTMNMIMNVNPISPNIGHFEIRNDGTLPIAVNYQTFQPIREVMVGGVPVCIKIDIDTPPSQYLNEYLSNGFIAPGDKCSGTITVSTVAQNLGSVQLVDSNSIVNSDFVGGLFNIPTNYSIATESQTASIDIPIGCGIWEELLTLNTTLNINKLVSLSTPILSNPQQVYPYVDSVSNQSLDFLIEKDPNLSIGASGNGEPSYAYFLNEYESINLFNN